MKKKIISLIIIFSLVILGVVFTKNLLKKTNKHNKHKDFSISKDNGVWSGKDSGEYHYFSKVLSKNLYNFFKSNNAHSIIDLGAGQGDYTRYFISQGIFASCYDGNVDTQELSDGLCAVLNLAQPLKLAKYDWVLSLEVGEHLPKNFEDTFIANLDRLNTYGVVLSWAIPGQGGDGHVNEQDNDYIKQKFIELGYINDTEAEEELRKGDVVWWFKNTIMVFRKPTVTLNN